MFSIKLTPQLQIETCFNLFNIFPNQVFSLTLHVVQAIKLLILDENSQFALHTGMRQAKSLLTVVFPFFKAYFTSLDNITVHLQKLTISTCFYDYTFCFFGLLSSWRLHLKLIARWNASVWLRVVSTNKPTGRNKTIFLFRKVCMNYVTEHDIQQVSGEIHLRIPVSQDKFKVRRELCLPQSDIPKEQAIYTRTFASHTTTTKMLCLISFAR